MIDTYMFGEEFVAMKIGMENILGIIYKLRCIVNKNKPSLPTPLSKGGSNFTYVGMLIAITQEKIKQEYLVLGFHLI